MQYTDHLKLDLYESDDPALLTDGYNNSMRLIDQYAISIDVDISTIQQTLALLTEKISALDTRVTALETKASQ